MEILHKSDNKGGKFYICDGDTEVATMPYVFAGDTQFTIDHTEVNEAHKGKSMGLKLVVAAVDFARTNTRKIISLCPFAKSVFDKRTDLKDVLS